MTPRVASIRPAPARRFSATPCERFGPGLWFAERPADLELAKRLCKACPVQSACLAGACQRGEPHGVWGGEIFDHGVVISHKRPRGRPRKHPRTCEGK
jgi:WhiB family redox-sensing transcriptional regulator